MCCGVRAGLISYPFSTRELVAISRHLQAYPQDALMKAVANVVAFDRQRPVAACRPLRLVPSKNVAIWPYAGLGGSLTAQESRLRSAKVVLGPTVALNGYRVAGEHWWGAMAAPTAADGASLARHRSFDAETTRVLHEAFQKFGVPLLHKAERFVVDLAEESLPEGHPRAPGAADAAASESRLWGEHLAALEADTGSSGVRLEQAAGAVEVGLTPLLLARRDASYLISNAKEMPTVNHHDARVSRFTEELFW